MDEMQSGSRRPFAPIATFVEARRIARRAAICGIVFAAMYVIGIVVTLWGVSTITGEFDAGLANSMYIVVGINMAALPVILLLSWRVNTGRGYISAIVLTLWFASEIVSKVIGGSAANFIIVLYLVMGVLLIDGVRACFIGARLAKQPINPAEATVFD